MNIQGMLYKRGGGHRSWKNRHFVMYDTVLKYFKSASKAKDVENSLG